MYNYNHLIKKHKWMYTTLIEFVSRDTTTLFFSHLITKWKLILRKSQTFLNKHKPPVLFTALIVRPNELYDTSSRRRTWCPETENNNSLIVFCLTLSTAVTAIERVKQKTMAFKRKVETLYSKMLFCNYNI